MITLSIESSEEKWIYKIYILSFISLWISSSWGIYFFHLEIQILVSEYICAYIWIHTHTHTHTHTHEASPESMQPHNMKNGDICWRRYKTQETLYLVQWCFSPLQRGTLGPHVVLPVTISCPVIFSWISPLVWNLFPFKGDFSFRKSQK